MDCIWNRIPVVENLWKIATIYFQARSVFRPSKMRENVAETADTVDIASVGIDYGKLYAVFTLFFFISVLFSLKNILSDFSKNRHAQVQFYLRRVHSFSSVNVRFTGKRKPRYANIKNLILPCFHDRRHFCTLERNAVVTQHLTSRQITSELSPKNCQ